jgi:diguanylate cyclase (GGDEF)-like protein
MSECLIWSLSGVTGGVAVALVVAWRARRERDRYVREMERMVYHDALTALPNRLLFLDRASVAFAHAKRDASTVAIVFLDLDRFKLVNDSLGHSAGDEVLRTMARRLRESLREGDTVARIGGDEFTLVMPHLHQHEDVVKIATKLIEVLRRPIEAGGRQIVVTGSIGITMYPQDGSDPEMLLRNADAAMYRAKERGGDGFQMYTSSFNAQAFQQLELESRLRRAVERQEFVLHYQPRVDLAEQRIVAFEALIRWLDPEGGLRMPRDFIATAETSGLILPIGEWVFRSACRQVRQWHEEGCPELFVSVNVSVRQFRRPDLTQTILAALEEANLEPHFLELEIDERCLMSDADGSMQILHALKEIGVRVLVSGFGAGYSSISYLQLFPIDGVKLDRSFSDKGKRPLASAALGMAKALNLKVIGEGVETQETADFLRAIACDDMQGYLVSRPVPAQDCQQFM